MNILVLAPQPLFADRGTPIAVRALLQGLSRLGHAVDVLSYHEGTDVDIPRVRHLRIRRPPLVRGVPIGPSWQKAVCDLYLLVKVISLLRRTRYDLIHAVEESAFIAAGLRAVVGLPFVMDMDSLLSRQIRERSVLLAPAAGLCRWLERWAIRSSAGVLAVCPALVDEALRLHPTGHVALLPDMPIAAGPRDELPAALTRAPRPRLLYVGNLEAYQGIDLMLRGYALLLQPPGVFGGSLVVVGGSRDAIRHYRRLSASLGIADRVRFVGPLPVERLRQVLDAADLLLSPRIQGNNTPMKIYSYLASGRAIVATRLPTHTQVLDDGIAHLVEPDAASLAQGVSAMLADPAARRRLGARAREHAESQFGAAAFHRRLRAFYGSIGGAARQPAAAADGDGDARKVRRCTSW